jgi:hypothetical protein
MFFLWKEKNGRMMCLLVMVAVLGDWFWFLCVSTWNVRYSYAVRTLEIDASLPEWRDGQTYFD